MKYKFLGLLMVTYSMAANAAFTVCKYQADPCDKDNNHYHCSIIGWTGPNPPRFCSATDVSSFKRKPKVGTSKFTEQGEEACKPWTDGVHYDVAERAADLKAAQACAPQRSQRVSDYDRNYLGSTCSAVAEYTCVE